MEKSLGAFGIIDWNQIYPQSPMFFFGIILLYPDTTYEYPWLSHFLLGNEGYSMHLDNPVLIYERLVENLCCVWLRKHFLLEDELAPVVWGEMMHRGRWDWGKCMAFCMTFVFDSF